MIRFLATMLLLAAAVPATAALPIAGRWITQDGQAQIEIGPCGNTTCGRIHRILRARPGSPTTDVNNSEAALRRRPILGLSVLTDFRDDGESWRGRIYDPRTGGSYRSVVRRNPDGTLRVQGCVAVICRTQTWRRAR